MRYVTPPGVLLTTSDCARRLGVVPDWIRQLARAGHLQATFVTLGGQRLYSEEAIACYQRERDHRESARLRGGVITDDPDRDDAV